MANLIQSVALVQKTDGVQTRWFLRWDPRENYWRFVAGERLERESFRETALREVGWQLNLNRRADFLVSNVAQLSVEFIDFRTEDKLGQQVAVAFYQVHVYKKSAIEILESDSSGCWVSASEICAGCTDSGQTIDPQIVGWINQWQIIQPWQE